MKRLPVYLAIASVAAMVVFAIALGGIMALREAAEFEIHQRDLERVRIYVPESPPPQTGEDHWIP